MTLTKIAILSLFATLAAASFAHAGVPWERLSSGRFELALDDEAVLDNETGLVWQRNPIGQSGSIVGAQLACGNLMLGRRMGWRLPTLAELTSLIAPCDGFCISNAPELPGGHPFVGVNIKTGAHDGYWTSTVDLKDGGDRLMVYFRRFLTHVVSRPFSSLHGGHIWCVRGDTGA